MPQPVHLQRRWLHLQDASDMKLKKKVCFLLVPEVPATLRMRSLSTLFQEDLLFFSSKLLGKILAKSFRWFISMLPYLCVNEYHHFFFFNSHKLSWWTVLKDCIAWFFVFWIIVRVVIKPVRKRSHMASPWHRSCQTGPLFPKCWDRSKSMY